MRWLEISHTTVTYVPTTASFKIKTEVDTEFFPLVVNDNEVKRRKSVSNNIMIF